MSDDTAFVQLNPFAPWDARWGGYPAGLAALAGVAVLLVALTLWSYLGHPQATRRRVAAVLALRLAALAVALVTAGRPTAPVPIEKKPDPTAVLIGVDVSESMTVKDERNNLSRVDAVRAKLRDCEPLLKRLKDESDIETVVYQFAGPDFNPAAGLYDPAAPTTGQKSDYGTYLRLTLEAPRERPVVRHVVIGDGADNANPRAALDQAAAWGRRGFPLATVTVGKDTTAPNSQDLIVRGVTFEQDGVPVPTVPIKTDVTVVGTVDVFNYPGPRVKARVYFDGELQKQEEVVLDRQEGNKVRVTVKAPAAPGPVKVRLRVGRENPDRPDGELLPLPNEKSDQNNEAKSILPVTKDGVRVLVVDRFRWEQTRLRDALRPAEPPPEGKAEAAPKQPARRGRFDLYEVIRQSDAPPTADDLEWLDLDKQGYDVVIIGNLSYPELERVRLPDGKTLPEKLLERVSARGMGLMFLGGELAYQGYPAAPPGDPTKREMAFGDLLPVVRGPRGLVEEVGAISGPKLYQFVPTDVGFQSRVLRIGRDAAESQQLWDRLNATDANRRKARITGYSHLVPKAGGLATVYAFAADGDAAVPAFGALPKEARDPLLVGHQLGAGKGGRVLALAAYDTMMWEKLGQPRTDKGVEDARAGKPNPNDGAGSDVHMRFWRQCVLWLAGQEEDDAVLSVTPESLAPPAGQDLTVRLRLKVPTPAAGDAPPRLFVKVLAPGEYSEAALTGKSVEALLQNPTSDAARELLAALAKAPARTVTADRDGQMVVYRPAGPGEHLVVALAPKAGGPAAADAAFAALGGEKYGERLYLGEGRFIAQQAESQEMLAIAAQPEFMQKLADAGREKARPRGETLKLDELPKYLESLQKKLTETTLEYRPDWRRQHSGGFLPAWLVAFATLLCTEWGLRRAWGMV